MTTGYETLDRALREAIAPAIKQGFQEIAEAIKTLAPPADDVPVEEPKTPERVLEDSGWRWTDWAPMLDDLEREGFCLTLTEQKYMTLGMLNATHHGKLLKVGNSPAFPIGWIEHDIANGESRAFELETPGPYMGGDTGWLPSHTFCRVIDPEEEAS